MNQVTTRDDSSSSLLLRLRTMDDNRVVLHRPDVPVHSQLLVDLVREGIDWEPRHRPRALDGSIAPRLLESNPSRGGGVSNPSSARGPRRGGAPVRAKRRRREGLVRGRSSRSSRTLLGPGAALERGGARSAARGRVAELGGARGEGAAEHDGVDRVGRRRRDARREDGEGVASARSRTHAGGDPFRARRERPRDARCAFVWW